MLDVSQDGAVRRSARTPGLPTPQSLSQGLPFVEEAIKLTRGDLTDPSEAEHIAHVISLLLLLALEEGDERPEDDKGRAVQVTGQDIGESAEVLDIGEQFDGSDLHDGSRHGMLRRGRRPSGGAVERARRRDRAKEALSRRAL
jgi:hypothetical protein